MIVQDGTPHNIEAEQQVLGALLSNNDSYDRIANILTADHFFDPLHGRIFEIAAAKIAKGIAATPVSLRTTFEGDEGMGHLGGVGYLARLAGSAVATSYVADYAQIVRDCAARRALAQIGGEITARASDDGVDPKDQIEKAEAELFQLAEAGAQSGGAVTFLKSATEAARQAEAAHKRGDGLAGLPSGLMDFDGILGGLMDSNLIILAGRPSMGKTALAVNIATNIAKSFDLKKGTGGPVGIFSLEMSHEQLTGRILSSESGVPSSAIMRGQATDAQMREYYMTVKRLEALPIVIDDTPALHIAQLTARARRMKRVHGIKFLVVDYLQLMRGSAQNRVQEIGEISMGLKAIAKDLQIPVMALSQLSRAVEGRQDKRPQLSDLRESGSIEQDADVVMFAYRDEYYAERELGDESEGNFAERFARLENSRGKAELIIGKQRHGPIGTVELSFEGQFTRFGNLHKSQWSRNA